jgi:serine/threonine-protein kinase
MGSVWRAMRLDLETPVAVKVIHEATLERDPDMAERFRREAAAAAKIRSPHVVQILDYGLAEDGSPYLVMELLEGESLQERMKRGRALTATETHLLFTQVCQVLSRAHGMGIVHRDIKPANIFLLGDTPGLFAKVVDFGIAKSQAAIKEVELTKTGAMLGSPRFMSPEQFMSSKEVDHRADLWSLCVVTYQVLTESLCFTGDTIDQVMHAVIAGEYRPPTEVRATLPAALDPFFAKAFARDIDDRQQTARGLAEASSTPAITTRSQTHQKATFAQMSQRCSAPFAEQTPPASR